MDMSRISQKSVNNVFLNPSDLVLSRFNFFQKCNYLLLIFKLGLWLIFSHNIKEKEGQLPVIEVFSILGNIC